ncbi:MAG: NFYB/HAP3 family transcription factor subunit [Candidatus Micrarchaeota archaeon]|nr:NFYB/HAP3 family transcription factor subunit [Candidatus Micrarchaeota archaeon]MDE1804953.1 NFYB/HAP3 family transcription factor subunit [Candidatus Micrarchaeota archaeon]MDE1846816.1 NFYB/HAP3 family transcription factor subunit [Candidatus Micrarchaeota archaeon]
MASIPTEAVKKLVKKYAKVNITDDGAAAFGEMLEERAREISKFVVKNAKKSGREKITKADVDRYTVNSE